MIQELYKGISLDLWNNVEDLLPPAICTVIVLIGGKNQYLAFYSHDLREWRIDDLGMWIPDYAITYWRVVSKYEDSNMYSYFIDRSLI